MGRAAWTVGAMIEQVPFLLGGQLAWLAASGDVKSDNVVKTWNAEVLFARSFYQQGGSFKVFEWEWFTWHKHTKSVVQIIRLMGPHFRPKVQVAVNNDLVNSYHLEHQTPLFQEQTALEKQRLPMVQERNHEEYGILGIPRRSQLKQNGSKTLSTIYTINLMSIVCTQLTTVIWINARHKCFLQVRLSLPFQSFCQTKEQGTRCRDVS